MVYSKASFSTFTKVNPFQVSWERSAKFKMLIVSPGLCLYWLRLPRLMIHSLADHTFSDSQVNKQIIFTTSFPVPSIYNSLSFSCLNIHTSYIHRHRLCTHQYAWRTFLWHVQQLVNPPERAWRYGYNLMPNLSFYPLYRDFIDTPNTACLSPSLPLSWLTLRLVGYGLGGSKLPSLRTLMDRLEVLSLSSSRAVKQALKYCNKEPPRPSSSSFPPATFSHLWEVTLKSKTPLDSTLRLVGLLRANGATFG